MDPRYVVVEFWGGPLDGFHNGWTTDANVVLPERLIATAHARGSEGSYHVRVRGIGHYVYQWREAGP
jgi:hypothetical protein